MSSCHYCKRQLGYFDFSTVVFPESNHVACQKCRDILAKHVDAISNSSNDSQLAECYRKSIRELEQLTSSDVAINDFNAYFKTKYNGRFDELLSSPNQTPVEMHSILVTNGFSFEGYIINEYCGVINGECVIGTGFLSDLSAVVNDLLGTTSNTLSKKLREARKYATNQLESQARSMGANAIIGVDYDYISLAANMLGVIANGTAVKIVPVESHSHNTISDQLSDNSSSTL